MSQEPVSEAVMLVHCSLYQQTQPGVRKSGLYPEYLAGWFHVQHSIFQFP